MTRERGPKRYFTEQLLHWHAHHNERDLPWKNEKDPYKIWLSEIILQQTRALQGLPYYLNFIDHYPTIAAMANANDEDVFRIWQGLGYYNRCKNMLATARLITNELNGIFPTTFEGIIALKGIGPYTAAAIASFAYNLPHAVVDGNVYRVLSRYFGIDTPFDTTQGKKEFAELAQELLDTSNSSTYNQAIMDLGATVCTPKKPACTECPLQQNCIAYKQGMIDLLPVRSKKTQVLTRHFNYIVIQYNDMVWLRKRTGKDIWENLYEPLLIESATAVDKVALSLLPGFQLLDIPANAIAFAGSRAQRLTHRVIESTFFTVHTATVLTQLPDDGMWMTREEMNKIAYPKTVLEFFKANGYL